MSQDTILDDGTHDRRPIQPREKLDFKLNSGIPRFWNGGDPFKTRLFDAMSITFPVGERYFISTVRNYREQITDPHLQDEARDFIRQEAQHGMVHALGHGGHTAGRLGGQLGHCAQVRRAQVFEGRLRTTHAVPDNATGPREDCPA